MTWQFREVGSLKLVVRGTQRFTAVKLEENKRRGDAGHICPNQY